MTKRQEFPRKIKLAAFARCKGRCQICSAVLVPGKFIYDHAMPDALGGQPTLENCVVQCVACDKPKTSADVSRIRKADRQRAAHIGAKRDAPTKIASRGFVPAGKDRSPKPKLPPRQMFRPIHKEI